MRHGSLFSGIGGFDLAAQWMGWENVFHCEINEFCQKVLKYYWPHAKSYTDIKTTDFTRHRGLVDIVTGGFPCQPFSLAGKRKGDQDDRHLWPEMLRAIREISPRFIVGENVYGLVNWSGGLVFEQVQTDLENEGYEVTPVILPACGKNAPHKRERIWFVAYATEGRQRQLQTTEHWSEEKKDRTQDCSGLKSIVDSGTTTDTERIRQQGSGKSERQLRKKENGIWEASWSYDDGRWPTVSPVRGGNDGLPTKLAKQCLEGLGNAVVPQIPYEIFKSIEQFELSYMG